MSKEKKKTEEKKKVPKYTHLECEEAVQSASIEMLIGNQSKGIVARPFYAHILMNFRRNFTHDGNVCHTAGVYVKNGRVFLIVNTDWFMELKTEERSPVLQHEILHIVSKHQSRLGDRNHHRYNIAADIAINQYIENLPECALYPKKFDLPEELTMEQYYDLLEDKVGDPSSCVCVDGHSGPGSGMDGACDGEGNPFPQTLDDHGPMTNDGDGNGDLVDTTIREIVARSLEQASKQQGKLPAGVKRLIDDATKPSVNWRMILQRFVARAKVTTRMTTRKRPNRRYGYQFPGAKRRHHLHVLVGVDTSGSINADQLQQFDAEIKKIVEGDVIATVAECDAKVHRVYDYSNKIDAEFHGGGGTDFRPVFELLDEHKVDADCLIYLTDTYGTFPEKAPNIPVLWAITIDSNRASLPWGQVVEVDA